MFRYESAAPDAVDLSVKVRVDGNDTGSWLPGDSFELPASAKRWEVIPASGTGGAIVRIGLGRITSVRTVSQMAGSVSTIPQSAKVPQSAAMANSNKTVTSASALLLAANAARQYLFIQNNDPNGSLYVSLSSPAAAAGGVTIAPGGFWEPPCVPTGALYAIGSIASNPNVTVVEG